MCDSVELLKVDTPLVRTAGHLAEHHGLRGYDAVHLATVLRIPARRIVVTTWDRDLATASAANGVAVVPQVAFPVVAAAASHR
jgi:predicted nucleic acid-binding protein